jgi:hypothetical protein
MNSFWVQKPPFRGDHTSPEMPTYVIVLTCQFYEWESLVIKVPPASMLISSCSDY